jgi:tight adherence protein C
MTEVWAVLAVALTASLAGLGARGWLLRSVTLRRLAEQDAVHRPLAVRKRSAIEALLGSYMVKAGYRGAAAPAMFLGLTAACAGGGLLLSQMYRVAAQAALVDMVAGLPGGIGDLLVMTFRAGPWIIGVTAALIPALLVRARRRARVLSMERDLPLALELFATMGEAGLGFDAALGKLLRSRDAGRPLMQEFGAFQVDLLAGMPRTQALRQLARRVDVPSLTSFTISMVQAEQVGASMSETLRHQADDLRERRRENALLQAQALPVKLVFPLVICFLPGVFVSTLAPVLFQMIQVANSAIGGGR